MTIIATIYGRAAFEPRQHTTKAGRGMTTCRLAVDATGHGATDQMTLWVDVLAFGRNAEALAAVEKKQMVSAMGTVTLSRYIAKDGAEREQLTLLADSIVTARSARPGGRRAKGNGDRSDYDASHRAQAPSASEPFNDELSF